MDAQALSLHEAAREARMASDFLLLERLGNQMIAQGEAAGDKETLAWGNYHLGIAYNNLNIGAAAERATRAALALFEEIGDRFAAARVMMNLGAIEIDNNVNVAEARRLFEASAPVIRESGEPVRLAIALGNLGEICRLEGDYRGALKNAQESLQIFSRIDDRGSAAWQLTNIAHCHALLRDDSAALASMHAAYELLRRDPNPRWVVLYFDMWFILAAKYGRWETAARLLGFVDKMRDEKNQPRLQAMLPWLSAPKERLAREFTHERLDQLVLEGEALDMEAAQELAATIVS